MTVSKWIALSLVWIVGIVTIVGSSLKEEDAPAAPPVPVTVQFDLISNDLERDLGPHNSQLSDLLLTGSYNANQGETLTLNRNSISLNNDSRFTINIPPRGDELLTGESLVSVFAELDVGIGHNPVAGQFTSLFDGTTTTVTVSNNGVNVLIDEPDATSVFYGWSTFEEAENDADAVLDLRMAAAAYNMFDVVLRATRLAEDIIDDIESNKADLEAMGVNSPRTLTCDNTTDASHSLFWTSDPVGTGQGVIGDGDAFEVRYRNCNDASRGYYLQGDVVLTNYDPADSVAFSSFGINADLKLLYFSNAVVDDAVITPGADTPRFDGGLSLSYVEQAVTP